MAAKFLARVSELNKFFQLPERPDGKWRNIHSHHQAMSLSGQVLFVYLYICILVYLYTSSEP